MPRVQKCLIPISCRQGRRGYFVLGFVLGVSWVGLQGISNVVQALKEYLCCAGTQVISMLCRHTGDIMFWGVSLASQGQAYRVYQRSCRDRAEINVVESKSVYDVSAGTQGIVGSGVSSCLIEAGISGQTNGSTS